MTVVQLALLAAPSLLLRSWKLRYKPTKVTTSYEKGSEETGKWLEKEFQSELILLIILVVLEGKVRNLAKEESKGGFYDERISLEEFLTGNFETRLQVHVAGIKIKLSEDKQSLTVTTISRDHNHPHPVKVFELPLLPFCLT